MTDHPITPPPELVEQWLSEHYGTPTEERKRLIGGLATEAARWGADQELDADCKWLFENDYPHKVASVYLRKARRPEPLSLKEQALNDLDDIPTHDDEGRQVVDLSNIRRALEALPND